MLHLLLRTAEWIESVVAWLHLRPWSSERVERTLTSASTVLVLFVSILLLSTGSCLEEIGEHVVLRVILLLLLKKLLLCQRLGLLSISSSGRNGLLASRHHVLHHHYHLLHLLKHGLLLLIRICLLLLH